MSERLWSVLAVSTDIAISRGQVCIRGMALSDARRPWITLLLARSGCLGDVRLYPHTIVDAGDGIGCTNYRDALVWQILDLPGILPTKQCSA